MKSKNPKLEQFIKDLTEDDNFFDPKKISRFIVDANLSDLEVISLGEAFSKIAKNKDSKIAYELQEDSKKNFNPRSDCLSGLFGGQICFN